MNIKLIKKNLTKEQVMEKLGEKTFVIDGFIIPNAATEIFKKEYDFLKNKPEAERTYDEKHLIEVVEYFEDAFDYEDGETLNTVQLWTCKSDLSKVAEEAKEYGRNEWNLACHHHECGYILDESGNHTLEEYTEKVYGIKRMREDFPLHYLIGCHEGSYLECKFGDATVFIRLAQLEYRYKRFGNIHDVVTKLNNGTKSHYLTEERLAQMK